MPDVAYRKARTDMEDRDQRLVSEALGSMPPPDVSAGFLSRLNARIDAAQGADGWFGLADYRAWTLRLLPAAAVLALVAIFWPASSTPAVAAASFSPSSAGDWQRDVTANALLEAALLSAKGDARVR
jgi:hypothetical protein